MNKISIGIDRLKYFCKVKQIDKTTYQDNKFMCELFALSNYMLKLYLTSLIPKGHKIFKTYESYTRQRFVDLYECLCDVFNENELDSMFSFNGVIVPKEENDNDKEKERFVLTFLDIMLPALVKETDLRYFLAIEGPYEYGDVYIKENDVVIDCGANRGMFSAYAGRKGATVYAFEPFKHVIDVYLSKTAEQNPNINICNYALFDKEQELFFSVDIDSLGENKLILQEEESQKVNVQAITLDSYVHKYNIPKVDFIKADIEGAERYMLLGAQNVLRDFAPKISICTYHLPDDPKVLKELILQANPNYVIKEKWHKMYAYVHK